MSLDSITCNFEDYDMELLERRSGSLSGPLCVWNYFHRSALVLAHHPTPEAISTEAFVLQANDCAGCARVLRVYMIELSLVFGREINNAIMRVSLVVLSYRYPCSHIKLAGSVTHGCFHWTLGK